MQSPRLLIGLLVGLLAVGTAEPAQKWCFDRAEQCFFWAQVGECEKSAHFMLPHCAASCGACPPSSVLGVPSPHPRDVVMLGHASTEPIAFPPLPPDPVAELAAGELHVVMRLASGAVLTFGDDSMGQLGQPRIARSTPVTRRPPRQVVWPAPYTHLTATRIAAGRMLSGALLSDGSLITWGDNSRGACGVAADLTPMDMAPLELDALALVIAVPMRVPFPRAVRAFSIGESHSLLLDADGDVWAFGEASFGATCNGTSDLPVGVPEGFARCELPLAADESVVDVTAGAFHSLALTSSGRVLCWGDNTHGRMHAGGPQLGSSGGGDCRPWLTSPSFRALVWTELGAGRTDGFVYSMLSELEQGVHAGAPVTISDDDLDAEIDAAARVTPLTLPLGKAGARFGARASAPLALPLALSSRVLAFECARIGAHETLRALHTRTFHTALLSDSGRLVLFGDNAYGQLGSEPANASDVGQSETSSPLGPVCMRAPPTHAHRHARCSRRHARRHMRAAMRVAMRVAMRAAVDTRHRARSPRPQRSLAHPTSAAPLTPPTRRGRVRRSMSRRSPQAQGVYVRQVALGEFHSLALDNASRLFSFGTNTRHELLRMRGAAWDAFPSEVRRPSS